MTAPPQRPSWVALLLGITALLLTACSPRDTAIEQPALAVPAPTSATEPLPGTTDARLDAFPGPDTTGVPAGVVLTPSGPLRLTTPGQVVDGLDVDGCVVIAADDVTIRNSRIRCADAPRKRAVVAEGRRTGILLEDVEVDGRDSTEIGVDVSGITLRRVEVHSVIDGVRMGGRITLEDSWVHDLYRAGTLHPDAVQGISAYDVVIRGNRLDSRSQTTRDLGNSAIMLGSETGTKTSRNVVIEDNFLDGGNYSLNISLSINASGFVVDGNVFGTGARYGPILTPPGIRIGENTRLDGTRAKVTVRRPS